MNYSLITAFTAASLFSCFAAEGQSKSPEGFFASQSTVVTSAGLAFVSIKKYNPSPDEIREAKANPRPKQLTPLTAPAEAVNLSLFEPSFESKIYAIDPAGNSRWDLTVGFSKNSAPSPLTLHEGFLYTGEAIKNSDRVRISKLDLNGKIIWNAELDSLHSVNDILVEGQRVTALLSFAAQQRVDDARANTFYIQSYPVYFFAQFDINTGKRIRIDQLQLASYLSSKGFTTPMLNSDYSYFLSNKDSVVYFQVMDEKSALVVSPPMDRKLELINMATGPESYHLLMQAQSGRYRLLNDLYGKKKKTETELPLTIRSAERHFLARTPGDSVVMVFAGRGQIDIAISDSVGKLTAKRIPLPADSTITAISFTGGRLCIAYVEGKNRHGFINRLKLVYPD